MPQHAAAVLAAALVLGTSPRFCAAPAPHQQGLDEGASMGHCGPPNTTDDAEESNTELNLGDCDWERWFREAMVWALVPIAFGLFGLVLTPFFCCYRCCCVNTKVAHETKYGREVHAGHCAHEHERKAHREWYFFAIIALALVPGLVGAVMQSWTSQSVKGIPKEIVDALDVGPEHLSSALADLETCWNSTDNGSHYDNVNGSYGDATDQNLQKQIDAMNNQVQGFKNITNRWKSETMEKVFDWYESVSGIMAWFSVILQVVLAVRMVMTTWKTGKLPGGCITGVISFVFTGVLLIFLGGYLIARVFVSSLLEEFDKQLAMHNTSIFQFVPTQFCEQQSLDNISDSCALPHCDPTCAHNVSHQYYLHNCTELFNHAAIRPIMGPCERFDSVILFTILGLTLQGAAKLTEALCGGRKIAGMHYHVGEVGNVDMHDDHTHELDHIGTNSPEYGEVAS